MRVSLSYDPLRFSLSIQDFVQCGPLQLSPAQRLLSRTPFYTATLISYRARFYWINELSLRRVPRFLLVASAYTGVTGPGCGGLAPRRLTRFSMSKLCCVALAARYHTCTPCSAPLSSPLALFCLSRPVFAAAARTLSLLAGPTPSCASVNLGYSIRMISSGLHPRTCFSSATYSEVEQAC